MASDLICPRCNARPKKKHRNSKWCEPCAKELVRRPRGELEPWQIEMVHSLKGKITWDEIAARIGSTRSNLNRWRRDAGIHARSDVYPQGVIREVCAYYEEHGRPATEERFPNVRVRSIVERYAHAPRQLRWTPEQLVELVRMAGLVSLDSQAKYFNRPNANKGSIRSAWTKIFEHGGGSVNGLSWSVAKHFVRRGCPAVEVAFWRIREGSRDRRDAPRRVALWTDVAKHLKPDVPEHIARAVEALARFQVWLHGGGYARCRIKRMIEERELERPVREGAGEKAGKGVKGAREASGQGGRPGRGRRPRGLRQPARREQTR